MKLEPDDPRLSAWVLGELPPEEAAAVARAVAADPELHASAAELRHTADFLSGTLSVSALRPDQRESVLRAGRAPATAQVIAFPAPRKPHRAWPALLGAAAVLALGIFIASRTETGNSGQTVQRQAPGNEADLALLPLPGPRISPATPAHAPDNALHRLARELQDDPGPLLDSLSRDLASMPLPDASDLPATAQLPPLRDASEVKLPVLVGRASYDWVRGWIREKNELPPKDAVRIEELANAFPLPAAEETREFAGLRVACVSMASLWSGPGRLVGVQIANESTGPRQVNWSFSPAAGSRAGGVRVLASAGGSGEGTSLLPPGRRTLVLIELASAAGDAGDLIVASGGHSKRFPALETRDPGLKQAGLVAAFGMWLRGEGIDNARLTEILASAEKENNPAWADSRQLVREALSIAAKAPAKDAGR